jgi:hypothetical protein
MKRISLGFLVLIAIALAGASSASAHGRKKHILGSVEKITPDFIVVKDKDGKSIEAKIVPATIFLKNERPAKLADLSAGDRVVIHATEKDGALEADEVKFGSQPSSAGQMISIQL